MLNWWWAAIDGVQPISDPTGGQGTHLLLGSRTKEAMKMRAHLVTVLTTYTQLAQVRVRQTSLV